MNKESWLTYTSRDYDAEVDKWNYVADHLEGTVIDDKKIEKYLHRRQQGESDDAYTERKNIADYTPHFARAALTLAGMLWAVDYDARRRWTKEDDGEGLGDPREEGTKMHRLWQNSDGQGTNWPTLWKGATIDAIAYQRFFVLVEGVQRDDAGRVTAEPSVRIVPPQSVLRVVRDDAGRPSSVKVKTTVDVERSQRRPFKTEERYLIFDEEGVETWRQVKEGKLFYEGEKPAEEMVGQKRFYGGPNNPGFRYLDVDLRTPILPIFEVSIPIRANLGYIMARKANSIFNQQNTLDFLLWISCFPKLFADVKGPDGKFDSKQWDTLIDNIAKGFNVLPGAGNRFDAPPTGPAEIKHKILAHKVIEFFATFFQAYGDAASERTATEIRQDFRAGVEAFLTLLGTTMDEAENAALWRLEQIEFPGKDEVWGGAFVERSTDFQPVSIEQRIESLVRHFMPNGKVPLDVETSLEIAVKVIEASGVPVTPDRKALLKERMQTAIDREGQADSLLGAFGVAA